MKIPQKIKKSLISRLTDPHEGQGWSDDLAKQAVKHYQNFLKLIQMFPDEELVPTRAVDEVWHCHILDTRSYVDWCNQVFGQYLHHDPDFGRGGQKQTAKLKEAFEKTNLLYRQVFNADYLHGLPGSASFCSGKACIGSLVK